MLEVRLVPAFSDNYVYVVHDPGHPDVAVVDPGDAAPVIAALDREGLVPTQVLLTHHHADHIGGAAEIARRYGARIVGHGADRERLPPLDHAVGEGDRVFFGGTGFVVLAVPGHTRGHIAYWSEDGKAAFTGDTLFALGCGRLFEGTAEEMWRSLLKLRALPDDTRVYCGHEYTQSNARFATALDPANQALAARAAEIQTLRAEGRPTIPSTIALERQTNPFLRADDPALAAAVALPGEDPVPVFAEIRRRKDAA